MTAPILASAALKPLDLVQAPATPGGPSNTEAARQFEGLLMAQMFKEMRKTVHTSSLFGDSGGSRATYEYLLDQAVVTAAQAGGRTWGLAERMEASLDARKTQKKAM